MGMTLLTTALMNLERQNYGLAKAMIEAYLREQQSKETSSPPITASPITDSPLAAEEESTTREWSLFLPHPLPDMPSGLVDSNSAFATLLPGCHCSWCEWMRAQGALAITLTLARPESSPSAAPPSRVSSPASASNDSRSGQLYARGDDGDLWPVEVTPTSSASASEKELGPVALAEAVAGISPASKSAESTSEVDVQSLAAFLTYRTPSIREVARQVAKDVEEFLLIDGIVKASPSPEGAASCNCSAGASSLVKATERGEHHALSCPMWHSEGATSRMGYTNASIQTGEGALRYGAPTSRTEG